MAKPARIFKLRQDLENYFWAPERKLANAKKLELVVVFTRMNDDTIKADFHYPVGATTNGSVFVQGKDAKGHLEDCDEYKMSKADDIDEVKTPEDQKCTLKDAIDNVRYEDQKELSIATIPASTCSYWGGTWHWC